VPDEGVVVVAMMVDISGVRLAAGVAAMHERIGDAQLFWLDVYDGDERTRTELLGTLGLDSSEIAWALRFGQAGRMYIGRDKLRAVTWIADPSGNVHEVHVYASRHYILTIWNGAAAPLDEIRQLFGERLAGLENSRYAATGILLQLLLGTLDYAIQGLDLALDALRAQLDKDPATADVALLSRRMRALQSIMSSFNRYSSAVRSAIVGIEAVPGMDERGAAELNEYADQVEDVEEEIHDRRRWMSDIMHDHATAIAQRQGEQINRLTLVSLIFLPVTALSGFFGMNFNWMIDHIAGAEAFVIFGVLLPVLSVLISMAWFLQRGLIKVHPWRRRVAARRSTLEELELPRRPGEQADMDRIAAETVTSALGLRSKADEAST
jgi:Mg2+ and Co2+ transporter CorA